MEGFIGQQQVHFKHPNVSQDDVLQVLRNTEVGPLKHMEAETQLFSTAKRAVL